MAYRTEEFARGDGERGNMDEFSLPLTRLNPYGDYPKLIGPLSLERDLETLSVRRENAGGLGVEVYIFFAIAMLAITLIGFLGMMQGGQSAQATGTMEATRSFAPTNNHFALLWIIGIVCLLVGVPLYIKKAYGAALVFLFDKKSDYLYENKIRVAPLHRVECIAIRETKDPDDRFLYLLEVLHTDGHELLLYNGYEERHVMTLASEIAGFLNCRTKYTGVKT
ncbi:MAG: hypothetical protein H7145_10855 [Akkermansiaceae bacterium]|nr:hypothetical protein [Armatimonadota bacterium]